MIISKQYKKYLFLFAITLLIFCFLSLSFYYLIGIRFTNMDDMSFLLNRFWPYWDNAFYNAKIQGRITAFFTTIFAKIPFFLWQSYLYDILILLPIAIIGFLCMYLISLVTKSSIYGIVYFIFYFSFLSLTQRFNLLVSYPAFFTSGIILFLVAIFFMHLYFEKRRLQFIIYASFCLYFSLLFHETLAVTFIVIVISFTHSQLKLSFQKKYFFQTPIIAIIGVLLLYIIPYLIWRYIYPPQYIGTQLSFDNKQFLSDYLQTFIYYIKASFPLYHVFADVDFSTIATSKGLDFILVIKELVNIFQQITFENFLFSLASVFAFIMSILFFKKQLEDRILIRMALLGFLILIIPPLIIALNPAYQIYVKGGYAPLYYTFFCYYGAIFITTSFVLYFIKNVYNKKLILNSVLTILGLVLFLATSISYQYNNDVALTMKKDSEKWNAINLLINNNKSIFNIEEYTIIVAPQLWNNTFGTIPKNYWDALVKTYLIKDIRFIQHIEDVDLNSYLPNIAYLRFFCLHKSKCHILLSDYNIKYKTPFTVDSFKVISTNDKPVLISYIKKSSENKVLKVFLKNKLSDRELNMTTINDDQISFSSIKILND